MVYYKPVKTIIDVTSLAEIIMDIVVRYYSLFELNLIDQSLLFTSKFWSLFCYFFGIKQKLFTIFYLPTDNKTKRQNNKIQAYLRLFVN